MKLSTPDNNLTPIWKLWPDALKYEIETPFDAKLPDRQRSAPWRQTFRERPKPTKSRS